MECYCKILDKDKSPSGEIFIPHNSKVAAEWVLTSATVFVAKMSHSLVGRFKGSQVMYAELQKQYDALKAENDQLKLEIAQAELAKVWLYKKYCTVTCGDGVFILFNVFWCRFKAFCLIAGRIALQPKRVHQVCLHH